MKLIYLSSICPKSQNDYIMKNHLQSISIAANKFNQLLVDGLSAQEGAEVSCIVSNIIHEMVEKNLTHKDYSAGGRDVYLKLHRGRFKYLKVLIETLKYIRSEQKANPNTVVVCDAVTTTYALCCVFARFLYKIKTVGLITDFPNIYVTRIKFADRLTFWCMKHFSSYIFLTEFMNCGLNKKGKPYCVIEGFCDINAHSRANDLGNKYTNKVCIYAGFLYKQGNIAELIQAFDTPELQDYELHIYGKGSYQEEIAALCQKSRNAKYKGMVPNEEVLQEEAKASLLINPRATDEEYTKHSFPSKNMEYMASGTPLLTTKLPGMPPEYYDYVYLIEEETIEGMRKILIEILGKPADELHDKGMKAREFVLKEKNNILQAKKVLDLISKL